MNNTENYTKSKLPKPTKDIFEDFIYKEKFLEEELSLEAISILRYVYYCMYRNRIKPENNHQEVAKISYPTIAKYSAVGKRTVERLIPFLIQSGWLHLISGGGKTKRAGTYCPGVKIYELYPQN